MTDAAWAKLALPLAPDALHGFMRDIETVLRINPCIEFERLIRMPGNFLQLAGHNASNDQPFNFMAEIADGKEQNWITLRYDKGIKRETRFEIAPDANGSVLTITETYDTPSGEEQEQRLAEVDHSLTLWAAGLRAHVLRRARWGNVPGYGWLVERFWLGMPPRQRRLARMIIWTTVLEFVVFLAVLAAYVAA